MEIFMKKSGNATIGWTLWVVNETNNPVGSRMGNAILRNNSGFVARNNTMWMTQAHHFWTESEADNFIQSNDWDSWKEANFELKILS